MTALLTILIPDRVNKDANQNDHNPWKLNHFQHAAQVLKMALNKWATSVNQLKLQTHKVLREYLNDPKSSWASQFGALTAFCHLGPAVLIECLLPQMDRYLTSIEAKLSQSASRKRNWLQCLHGTLLQASRSILGHLSQNNCEDAIGEVYAMMAKHFGDALFFSVPFPTLSRVPKNSLTDTSSRLKIRSLPQVGVRFGMFEEDSFMHANGCSPESKIPFSISANQQFECVNHGVEIQPRIHFNVRSLVAWPEERLKRKRHQQRERFNSNYKSFGGCIGKRLLGVPGRSSRQKISCISSISNIVL